jgi:cysteine desulfurase/selenocysteine lyase
VQAIGCDFLAFSGHKMCGPTGIGVLYGRRALLDKLAPDETGGGMVVQRRPTTGATGGNPPPNASKPALPNVAGAIGLGAACDYLDSTRPREDRRARRRPRRIAMEKLSALPGIRIIGPRRARSAAAS